MLDAFVSFAAAALSGTGIGGGGLLVIWLTEFCGTEQLTAQGINLVWFLFSSTAAMTVHLVKRRLRFFLWLFLTVFGICGAVLGSRLAHTVSPETVRTAFGCLLIISGTAVLFRK